jgi:hypothetical protein
MLPPIDPATRPSRIPLLGQLAVILLLGTSFGSGVLLWWGQTIQARDLATPPWLHGCLVLHGSLNPLLCILFGVLLWHHIRVGWTLRANLLSGFLMEAVFAGLIASGVGLYYIGNDATRASVVLLHRGLGLLLPLTLAAHWFSGIRWAGKATPPAPPRNFA